MLNSVLLWKQFTYNTNNNISTCTHIQSAQEDLTELFIATLFKTAKKRKQPKCQSTDELIFENAIQHYDEILFYSQSYHKMDDPQKHYAH